MIRKALLAFALAVIGGNALADYAAQPRDNSTLQGSWRVNEAASDNVDQIVAKLIEKDEKERRQWRRRMQDQGPIATLDLPPEVPDPGYRSREENEYRSMLGITKTLKVTQAGTRIEIASDVDTRRYEAGSVSQVSMSSGDLADAQVGWDGEWFVIDRKVPGRLRQVEQLRLIKKTGQLEYISKWSGDTELSGVKLRRVFDPITIAATPGDPELGPVPP